MLRNFATILLILITFNTIGQNCEIAFDLRQWNKRGSPDADWNLVDSSNVINASYVFPSTFFVSPQQMINVKIRGTMSVETSFDDDFFGIVFGYKKPTNLADDNDYNFFLFDWKAKTGTVSGYAAREGFRLSYYNGFISRADQKILFWSPENSPPKRRLIKEKYGSGLGWEPYRKYEFELIYTASHILISIDGEVIFEHTGCFEPGSIGFYCMSQELTRFENFSYEYFIDFVPSSKSACIGEEISFYPYDQNCAVLPDFVDSLRWDFGDGNQSKDIIAVHSYEDSGTYPVELLVWKSNQCSDTITYDMTIKQNPIVNLGKDISLIACTGIILDAQNEGSEYYWSTSETTQTIEINPVYKDSSIWVEVSTNNCKASDTIDIFIEISQDELYFPTAFSPNYDGKNDVFIPIGSTTNVTNFQMDIFNRWGQMIFHSDDPHIGWDGTTQGKQSPMGTYIVIGSYNIENYCVGKLDYSFRSTLNLIQ